jgi:hypothetical protein
MPELAKIAIHRQRYNIFAQSFGFIGHAVDFTGLFVVAPYHIGAKGYICGGVA